MVDEEKYLQWMEEYFQQEDGDALKKDLIELSKSKKLFLVWSSSLYGRLGMVIRNYMREKHPEIDNDWQSYGEFEDYSWELFQKLIKKWEN